jgi:nicotinamidase-related amidase
MKSITDKERSDGAHLHGPLPGASVHLCLDMQRLLAPEGPWPTPWIEPALERQVRLIERRPEATIFTRFIPPKSPDDMPGTWRQYYEKWRHVTRDFIDPGLLELLEDLEKYVPPAAVVDKTRYSAFSNSRLQILLAERHCSTLIVSGAETDVCVLATVVNAVDLGYRVVIASDAICSSSDECHDALMTLYHKRFSQQIEIASTEIILENWQIA